mgnify:CR=1 FL=1
MSESVEHGTHTPSSEFKGEKEAGSVEYVSGKLPHGGSPKDGTPQSKTQGETGTTGKGHGSAGYPGAFKEGL